MVDNNNQIITNDEPTIDVDSSNNGGFGNKSSSSNSNIKYITIIISIIISVIIYFLVFSGGNKNDIVDPNQIVKNNDITNKANATIENIDNVIGVNYDDVRNQESNRNIVNEELLKLPELPPLPQEVTKNIEEEVEKETKKEEKKDDNTFTTEEVNELINLKLKSFEDEMKRIKDESERLSRELEEKKIEEEKQKKERKLAQFITPNIINQNSPVDASTNTPADGLPPNISGYTIKNLDEQKKEEERQLLIAQRKRIMQERKGSSMFKMQGGGGGDPNSIETDSIIITNKDSLKNVKETKTETVTTKTADLSRTITQGKIISATLESAIDTDVQNQVRAVVSRDIYSDMGKNILIPKGSKIIGNYQTVTSSIISRLNIVWTRIIRSDGLNISLSANTSDGLGRGGVKGELDNKYDQVVRNAFLSSVVSIATAALVDKITNTVTTTTSNGLQTSTTTNATNQAIIDSTKKFGDEMQSVVDNLKKENPTIRIAQGTKINVVVNQDLVLPIYKQKK